MRTSAKISLKMHSYWVCSLLCTRSKNWLSSSTWTRLSTQNCVCLHASCCLRQGLQWVWWPLLPTLWRQSGICRWQASLTLTWNPWPGAPLLSMPQCKSLLWFITESACKHWYPLTQLLMFTLQCCCLQCCHQNLEPKAGQGKLAL